VRTGQLEFLAGAFFTYQDSHFLSSTTAENADGTPLPAPVDNIATQGVKNTFQEEPLSATRPITSRQLRYHGGVRYTKDKQGGLITVDGLFIRPGAVVFGRQQDFYRDLAMATLARSHCLCPYRDGATVLRTGEQPGRVDPQLCPDTVTDYELGTKGSLFQTA